MTINVEHNLNECHDACRTALFKAQQEVKVLLAKGEMLAAVVQGAREDFVRVPYGASHEDVAAINDWHKMAAEALNEWMDTAAQNQRNAEYWRSKLAELLRVADLSKQFLNDGAASSESYLVPDSGRDGDWYIRQCLVMFDGPQSWKLRNAIDAAFSDKHSGLDDEH